MTTLVGLALNHKVWNDNLGWVGTMPRMGWSGQKGQTPSEYTRLLSIWKDKSLHYTQDFSPFG
eukprot:6161830-Amphidinium_carterae.1